MASTMTTGSFVNRLAPIACLVLFACSLASAQCQVPHFHVGQDYYGSIYISISPRDFTVNKLACIGQALKRRRPDSKGMYVVFFSSYEAALRFKPPGTAGSWPRYERELHAVYDLKTGQQATLDIFPVGFTSLDSLYTTITLPSGTAPHCHLQVQNRCLMAVVQQVTYPAAALQAKTSGDTTLTAQVNSEGRVTNVKVAAANANPQGHGDALASAAIQNLKTWQFDAGTASVPFRITFSYVIDSSLPPGMDTAVKWDLPDRVVIRGKPPK